MNNGKTLFARLMDFVAISGCGRCPALSTMGHGVRPVDLPGESARRRKLLVGADLDTLFHGLPRSGAALDDGRCQRGTRLAHLRGVGPTADRPGEARIWVSTSPTRSMRWARRPSIFVWRSFRGRISARPGAAVKMHTLLDLCGNTPSFIHVRMASCTTFTRSTCCSRRRPRSTSWIRAMSISPGSMFCISPELSSSPVPNRTWMPIGSIRPDRPYRRYRLRSDHRPAWSLHQPALPRTPKAHPLEEH
jgi:hypothetical protein